MHRLCLAGRVLPGWCSTQTDGQDPVMSLKATSGTQDEIFSLPSFQILTLMSLEILQYKLMGATIKAPNISFGWEISDHHTDLTSSAQWILSRHFFGGLYLASDGAHHANFTARESKYIKYYIV